jgi:hypothetical protein
MMMRRIFCRKLSSTFTGMPTHSGVKAKFPHGFTESLRTNVPNISSRIEIGQKTVVPMM